jgi:iron complex transport system permease protein
MSATAPVEPPYARVRGKEPLAGLPWQLAGAVVLAAASMVLGVLFGSDPVSLAAALEAPGPDRIILVDFRLPRVLLAALAGGGLALVGGAFQALLRNPLAEPYVLGVSGGAAVGATTAIALGVAATSAVGAAVVPAAALAGGLAATMLVYAVARRAPRGPAGASILLAGVMVNAIAAALISFSKLLVEPGRAARMLRWLVGFIELPSTTALLAVTGYVLVGSGWLVRDAGRMNLLALGDESAETLGVDVRALERRVFVLASCVVGGIVSLTGLIGFVGLVVPHAVRRVCGPDHRSLLPLAFLVGAAMLVACDLASRLAFDLFGTQLPVGAVTALIGGPVFLLMLSRGAASPHH